VAFTLPGASTVSMTVADAFGLFRLATATTKFVFWVTCGAVNMPDESMRTDGTPEVNSAAAQSKSLSPSESVAVKATLWPGKRMVLVCGTRESATGTSGVEEQPHVQTANKQSTMTEWRFAGTFSL
jgi:hypothetical protein